MSMKGIVRITASHLAELRGLLFERAPLESAAFALIGVSKHEGQVDLLVHRIIRIPDGAYTHRSRDRLEISPRAINGVAALCEATGLSVMYCHSHPADMPYSATDDFGERQLTAFFGSILGDAACLGSLLLCPSAAFGRLWRCGDASPRRLDRVVVVGDRESVIELDGGHGDSNCQSSENFDRQVRLWGSLGQRVVAASRVGVVGVGGTGSSVAEQLVRLGVKDLALVDSGIYEPSNITRVYGSFGRHSEQRDVPKVDLVADHLRSIEPNLSLRACRESVCRVDVARSLRDRDFLFLCTDEHWGRSVVNQVAYQYLLPALNVGVRVARGVEGEVSAVGAVDFLRPGLPCLWCKGFLDTNQIAHESIPSAEYDRLVGDGYVEGGTEPAPMVIALTTGVASLAIAEFLHYKTGFLGERRTIERLNLSLSEPRLARATTRVNSGCICSSRVAYGDVSPVLGTV